MKKAKKLCILLATLALGVATAGLTACDEVYTTAQTDELIASLQTKIDTNKAELDEKIDKLSTEYETKNNQLLQSIEANQQAITALRTEYLTKLADLELADETNAKAISDLKSQYLQKVEELETTIAQANKKIDENKTELNGAISALTNSYQAKMQEIDELLSTLNDKNSTQDEKIVELANKIAELEEATRIVDVTFATNGDLIITFGDGSKQTVEAPKQHEHNYGSWTAFTSDDVPCENRLFFRVCDDCHIIEWKQGTYDDHDWNIITTAPTCQAQGYDTKTCKVCGKVEKKNYTAIVNHAWDTKYSYDNSYHWYACATCDETKDKKEHTVQASGECSVCHELVGATEGVYYKVENGEAKVVGYDGDATRVRIAETYGGAPVTSIGVYAFELNYTIKEVIIPNTVTTIEDCAFEACSKLQNVSLSSNLEAIGVGAFKYTNLTSIDIPNSVNEIGAMAFWGTSLNSVTIPGSVETIESWTFYDCSQLTSVWIKDGVKSIDGAFQSCSKLTSVIIPDSVTYIGKHTFAECSGLKSVVIGSDIQQIDDNAFDQCKGLENIYYKGTVSDWSAMEIGIYNSKLISAKRYYYIEKAEDLPTDGGKYWHYDEQGNIVIW